MMNKKLLLAGAVAVAGFFTLTAFDGKTLAQQKEEIAAAVTAKLEMLRTEKTAECDTRVQTEATTRIEAWKAEMAAAPAPGKGGTKKGGSKGPKVDPLPVTPPPAKVDPKKDKMDGGTKVEEKNTKMEGGPTNTEKKKKKMGGGN
ncbi:MAG: hypothetical protein H7246_13645 [Phycisphaerae bacterium]|nr:hypothetical protein [Saprospiraceae bacterium]